MREKGEDSSEDLTISPVDLTIPPKLLGAIVLFSESKIKSLEDE